MIKVLIADEDLDFHELMDDVLEINFRDVKIDRALSIENFWNRIKESGDQYDLILFNFSLQQESKECVLNTIKKLDPMLMGKLVLVGNKPDDLPCNPELMDLPFLKKPFSLDHFGEVVKKTCAA
ncbi:MAG: hypothetical protein ACLFVQ_05625 [Chitinispirillaceae bacterium]